MVKKANLGWVIIKYWPSLICFANCKPTASPPSSSFISFFYSSAKVKWSNIGVATKADIIVLINLKWNNEMSEKKVNLASSRFELLALGIAPFLPLYNLIHYSHYHHLFHPHQLSKKKIHSSWIVFLSAHKIHQKTKSICEVAFILYHLVQSIQQLTNN